MKEAREAVTVEVVNKSSRSCGISVNVNGSEEEEIYCIKDSGVAPQARAAQSTTTLLAPCEDEVEEDNTGTLSKTIPRIVNVVILHFRCGIINHVS